MQEVEFATFHMFSRDRGKVWVCLDSKQNRLQCISVLCVPEVLLSKRQAAHYVDCSGSKRRENSGFASLQNSGGKF